MQLCAPIKNYLLLEISLVVGGLDTRSEVAAIEKFRVANVMLNTVSLLMSINKHAYKN